MIGFVIVSHSAKLAEGVCELAGQVARGKIRIAAAGGTSDPGNPIGTDAFRVLQAIESVYGDDGVVVLMDLGSAVLSAETALEFLDEPRRQRVHLCPGPLVEGAVAAVSQAAAGASLDEILREAQGAVPGIRAQLRDTERVRTGAMEGAAERLVSVANRLGLHARPAAQLIRLARRFQAGVTIENITKPAGPFDAQGINGLLSLGARRGHQLRIRAHGVEAQAALSAVARFIESGCGDRDEVREIPGAGSTASAAAHGELAGVGGSAGIAIGPLACLRQSSVVIEPRVVADPEAEWERLLAAIHRARNETRVACEWARAHGGEDEAGIFDAQLLFLEDPALIDAASKIIHQDRQNAGFAWQAVTQQAAERIASLEDSYQRARAADVEDVASRVLRSLSGAPAMAVALNEPSILSAHDLTPSEVKDLDPVLVLGVCLETGSASAHSTILLRAMGIPAVVGLGPVLTSLSEGTTVAVDGERGRVCVSPDSGQARILVQRRELWLAARRRADLERHGPARTRDGKRVRVLANLNSDVDVVEALDRGAEGVGVLRTEFLFLKRALPPSEEEQLAAYRTIAEALGNRTLVIRTLDIGGDKSVPYVDAGEEANPFLGWRGIRLMLGCRGLLKTQVRAILRAGYGHNVEILLPMVSSIDELRAVKALVGEAEAELDRQGATFRRQTKVGVMIEVPAAVAIADRLAREASRLSIGTNDLVQYVMAADRTNARVAGVADHFQPPVLRMIQDTIQAGRRAGLCVDVCGEMAADLLATPLLIGMGLEEFSVSAPLIPELKRAIARWRVEEAEAIAREALALDSSEAVRRLLTEARGG